MTLNDQQVLDIVNALLDHEGVHRGTRVQHLLARRGVTALRALGPLIERYLAIAETAQEPPSTEETP
jgi:hypothetical protein